ncbi:MAG: FimV/HubP family polar landmark protein [Porticoccaceae bacterium]|nr:FimV/HubP family polar landmark protein [Porticoccaceae bacterium]MDG1307135.1 FimV/HubP family polar landmark protein [Porticoccaceae bacterium]
MLTKKWTTNLAAAYVLAAVFYTTVANAVGFGDITLNTALNEPLDAEISLTNVEAIDTDLLVVRLAPASAFASAGVTRDYYLTQLSFEIQNSAEGKTVVKVASQEPILEPYVDFLVELEWPEGRILQEYTLRLDRPTDSEKKVEPQGLNAAERKAAQAKTKLAAGSHRVVVGDTLWNVSKRLRPRGSTILQTMDALYKENINAFVDGDANRMVKGAILRLPSSEKISDEPGDIVSIQIGLAEQKPEELVLEVSDAAVETSADEGGDDNDPVDFESLDLYSERSSSEDGSASVNAPIVEDEIITDDGYEQLSSELAVAQDEKNRAELENAALRKRMTLLEAQVDQMGDQALEVKSDATVGVKQTPPETKNLGLIDSQELFSLVKQLQYQPWYIWAGVGVLALLLLLLIRRPKPSHDVDDEASAGESSQDNQEPKVNTGANLLIDDLDGLDLDPDAKLFDETDREIFPEGDSEVSPEIFDSMIEAATEAEVYLSLGNVDQAIDILEKARARDSGDTGSRLTLMEIYCDEQRLDELRDLQLEIELTGDLDAINKASAIARSEQAASDDGLEAPVSSAQTEDVLDDDQPVEAEQGISISDLLEDGLPSSDDTATDELDETVLAGGFMDDDSIDGGIFSQEPDLPSEAELKQTVGETVAKGLDDADDFYGVDDIDAVEVKLDLAKTYIEMDDLEGAREILEEIINEADQIGQAKARAVLEKL